MVNHLGGHADYDGAILHLGTVTFQTKLGTAKVRDAQYTVHKADDKKPKRQSGGQGTGRPSKSAKHDPSVGKMLELLERSIKSIEQKDSQMARLLARQEEQEARQEKREDQILQLIRTQSANPTMQSSSSRAISSMSPLQEEDLFKRFVAFQHMTR